MTQAVIRQATEGGEALVVDTADGRRAYLNRCPHQGAPLDNDGAFLRRDDYLSCAHHHAIFDLRTGVCIWGPCVGRSLTPASPAV